MNRIRNIKDLADLAGVSAGTVSRALSGSELISVRTREKVQALADEHGFRPNIMARNLRIQRSGAIAVMLPARSTVDRQFSEALFARLLSLLGDALNERGYDLLLSRVVADDSQWLERFVDSGRVDGVIIIGQGDQPEMLDALAMHYKPMVVWGGGTGHAYCSVGTDNRRGGDLAASHLLARGCRRLCFIGDPANPELSQRLAGVSEAMRREGLQCGPAIWPARFVGEPGNAELAALLRAAGERPDGIIAACDTIAMASLRALAELGLAVPGDVRVIGYDGLALGEDTIPRLSTITQDLVRGAQCLVDALLQRIAGEDAPSRVLEPQLQVRMSS